MISHQKIKDLKARREYFERRGDKHRLKQLDLEEKAAWKDDLTQPSDNRFKTLYPKQHTEIEKGRYEHEQHKRTEEKQRDALIHQFRHNLSQKQALTKLYGRENNSK